MSKKKIILVVEDEHFLSDIYKHQLEERGCGVHVAGDGLEALEVLTRVKPDVILLDLIMPAMNGFAFLEALRAQAAHKTRRVVVLTNLGQEEDQARVKALGVEEYLVKTQVGIEDVMALILR